MEDGKRRNRCRGIAAEDVRREEKGEEEEEPWEREELPWWMK